MLLRRISEHVKAQNWTAVALDFAIVVFGILIAFQITEWNEARQENREEKALIARLTEEFTALEQLLVQRIDRAEELVTNSADLIALVRSDNGQLNEVATKEMLNLALRYNAAIPPPNAFSEALQSGRIGTIRNEELRRVLYEYEVTTGWWNTVSGSALPQTDAQSNLLRAITLSAERNPEDFDRQRVLSYDWPLVKEAETELLVIYSKLSLQAEIYRLELVSVKNVLSTLEAS